MQTFLLKYSMSRNLGQDNWSFSCAAILSPEEESVVCTLFTHGKSIKCYNRACKKGTVHNTLRYRMMITL